MNFVSLPENAKVNYLIRDQEDFLSMHQGLEAVGVSNDGLYGN